MSDKKPYILGVDPGLKGAICVLSPLEDRVVEVFDVPTRASGVKNRQLIDVTALALKLGLYSDEVAFAVVEDVHSAPSDGHVGAFAFGKSTGVVIGVLGAYMVPTFFTPPEVWKNTFGLSRDKNKSRALAGKKYPSSSELFKLKKHDGRAEAVLLADFGKRFY